MWQPHFLKQSKKTPPLRCCHFCQKRENAGRKFLPSLQEKVPSSRQCGCEGDRTGNVSFPGVALQAANAGHRSCPGLKMGALQRGDQARGRVASLERGKEYGSARRVHRPLWAIERASEVAELQVAQAGSGWQGPRAGNQRPEGVGLGADEILLLATHHAHRRPNASIVRCDGVTS